MEKVFIQDNIDRIRKKIEEKKGGGSLLGWRYSQYKELANEIAETSGIYISQSTLVRILKQARIENVPQISTLNALVKYLGYSNWEAFIEEQPEERHQKTAKQRSFVHAKRAFGILGGLLIVACVFMGVISLINEKEGLPVELKLISNYDTYTRVLAFQYHVPSSGFDLHVIPQSFMPYIGLKKPFGKNFTQLLPQNDSIAFYRIQLPGFYTASIQKEGDILVKEDVMIETEHWIGGLRNNREDLNEALNPKYHIFRPSVAQGTLALPKQLQEQVKSAVWGNIYNTNYLLIRKLLIDANKITFDTRFKNISNQDLIAGQFSRITLMTTNGIIEIPLTNKNNMYNLGVWFSDYVYSHEKGHFHDRLIGNTINRWVNLRIEVANFEGKIYVDDQLVETIKYREPLGNLYGIRYKFTDIGEVDYCSITNIQGDTLFHDDFNTLSLNDSIKGIAWKR